MDYAQKIKALLSPAERAVFGKLTTPQKIQSYLDTLAINFEEGGETCMSPRRVIRNQKAHCIEGAMLAAAALAYHGATPFLMDFQTALPDDDHVIAVFTQGGYWGAISKTNHCILRYRDPVYKTYRELAMSYFHEYILEESGKKTLRAFSRPYDLTRYAPKRWVTAEENLEWVGEELDASRHFPTIPLPHKRKIRDASLLEMKVLAHTEWPDPRPKKPLQ